MISAATGGTLKVIGSSIAIVASGPMPGSTPISVPRNTPMKQNHRFCSDSATVKPKMRLLKRSISVAPHALDHWIRQAQEVNEPKPAHDGEADGKRHDLQPLEVPARRSRYRDQSRHGGYEPGFFHQDAERNHRERQHDERAGRPVTNDLLVILAQSQSDDVDAHYDHDAAQHGRKIARTHAQRRAERVVAGDPHPERAGPDVHQAGPQILVRPPLEILHRGSPPVQGGAESGEWTA